MILKKQKMLNRVILLNKGEIVDCEQTSKNINKWKIIKRIKIRYSFSLKIARKLQKKGYQIKDTLDVEELEKQLCQLHAKVRSYIWI